MGSQIIFFEKNKLDIDNRDAQILVTDNVAIDNGQFNVDFVRNRNNFSAWLTTGSSDSANTQLDISFGDSRFITDIILVGHNFKNYTIQYKSGLSYIDFSVNGSPIAPTNDTDSTSAYNFNRVYVKEVRIIINGTQVADSDKILRQLIITDRIGQLTGWPIIKRPRIGQNKKTNDMLSGKKHIVKNIGAFSCSLEVQNWKIQDDIDILDKIYFSNEGVLMWINANNSDQFTLKTRGYRKEDIYLVAPIDEYTPELVKGIYTTGIKQSISLAEVIE